jgi:hypothetical protein
MQKFWLESLKATDEFGDLGADGRIILKLIYNKQDWRMYTDSVSNGGPL